MAVLPQSDKQAAPADDSTRARLLDSALRHFAAKGYSGTSVREVIEDAGVTRPVLYYYFENKADLFCHLVETHFLSEYERIDAIIAKETECHARLVAVARNAFAMAEQSPETVRLLLRYFFAPPEEPMRLDSKALGRERFTRLVLIMQKGIDDGVLHGDAPALALAFTGLTDLYVMAKARESAVTLTPELAEALVDLFLAGAVHESTHRAALRFPLLEAVIADEGTGFSPNRGDGDR